MKVKIRVPQNAVPGQIIQIELTAEQVADKLSVGEFVIVQAAMMRMNKAPLGNCMDYLKERFR